MHDIYCSDCKIVGCFIPNLVLFTIFYLNNFDSFTSCLVRVYIYFVNLTRVS